MRGLLLSFVLLIGLAPAAHAVTVERVVSPGGIEAWLVQDHANPIIAIDLAFRGGAATDPNGKEGLANLTSGLLDEGAGDIDALGFQTRLEDLAIHLSFDAGRDAFAGSMRTLTENRDAAFELLRLALTAPRFDTEPVERMRAQVIANLRREAEDPDDIATKAWFKAAYPEHPYGRPTDGTPESVARITRADLKDFTARRLARDQLIVGVAGDITPAQLAPLLDVTFGKLPAKAAPFALPQATPRLSGEATVIARDIPQSVAIFGQGGLLRQDPDWYAAYTLNYIMGGGGFSSRLMAEVREKRGLAYSVHSYLYPFDRSAVWLGGVATKNTRIAESLRLIRDEWRRMAEAGPTEQELANAKTYLTGSWPLLLDGTQRIAGVLVAMQRDKLGIDYLERRNGFIEALTVDDLRRVASRLIKPDALTMVVVGTPDSLAAGATP